MSFTAILSFAGALLCGGLATFALIRDPRSFVHRTFAIGMIALGLEQALAGMVTLAVLSMEVIRWQHLRLAAAALLPAIWLIFSLSFGRANYKEFVAKWKWVALASFIFPPVLVTFFADSFFASTSFLDESSEWLLLLGWSGYTFYLLFLVGAVFILMNLERTLRAFSGSMRWQIKFMALGIGGLFAVRVYTSSQALLYSSMNMDLEVVNSAAVIMACLLIVVSFFRARFLDVDIYLSQAFLYNSVTVLIVGAYLLVVGVMAKAISHIGSNQSLTLAAFLVFLGLLGLTITLLSDELRQKVKRFINRNFHRPQYDYRKEWKRFTQRTVSVLDIKNLSASVAAMVSETFGVSAVTIWLLDETQERVSLGGSTIFSESQHSNKESVEKVSVELIRAMRDHQMPVDFGHPEANWAKDFKRRHQDFLSEAQVRYCVTLMTSQQVLGVMALNDRLTKDPFSVEDFDLLKTIADQAAANLLNLKLSDQLLRAKEMEAFQTVSSFFIHDFKNLASRLSLTMQNLSVHFDDPAFRSDALRVISQSVERINAMCSGLSLLKKGLEVKRTEADLNELVTAIVADLNGSIKASLVQDLHPVPTLPMDVEEIQKVLVNLLLNANEAVGGRGEIQVTTEQRNGWAVLSVSDNGCGMSEEFIARSLFQPFQTTKKQGLGIGLFHSKKIVEAHQGRIEVESEKGKGTTFSVMLPSEKAND
jgi:putative PEP-CTERM system histidine kinase